MALRQCWGTAAFMKAHQLATTSSLGEGFLQSRAFNIFVVEFELFFAVWLLFGLLPKLTWLATVGLFSVFASVSLYKALSGADSCGCFGFATINPWYTTGFDLGIIGFLLFFFPRRMLLSEKPNAKNSYIGDMVPIYRSGGSSTYVDNSGSGLSLFWFFRRGRPFFDLARCYFCD